MFNAKYKPTIIATQPDVCDLRQEFNERGMHRIVHSDGTATPFVRYESFAYYGGYVSVTAYWAEEGLYSAADFALMVAAGVVATQQQVADFESGKGRVLMRDLVDTPVDLSVAAQVDLIIEDDDDLEVTPVDLFVAAQVDLIIDDDDLEGTQVAVSVANSPKDYTKKPETFCVEDELDCEGCTHIVEDGVSGDWEKVANMLAAPAKPVTRH